MKRSFRQSSLLFALLFAVLGVTPLIAQQRDFHVERIVLDDDAQDGTRNTMTIQVPFPLTQNIVLTIPEPSGSTAEFFLVDSGSGTGLFWQLGGNDGTTPGTDFLGTTDSLPLYLQIRGNSGATLNSIILNPNGSLQRDSTGDARGADAVDLQIRRTLSTQVVSGAASIIGAGENNSLSGNFSIIGAGVLNLIDSTSNASMVGTGFQNRIEGSTEAVIVAGLNNRVAVSSQASIIGAGSSNLIDSMSSGSMIGAGFRDTIEKSLFSIIGAGEENRIGANSENSMIGAGESNVIDNVSSSSMIGAGLSNEITVSTQASFIGAGGFNLIDSLSNASMIGAGFQNRIDYSTESAIVAGTNNQISTSSQAAFIGAGGTNLIDSASVGSMIGAGVTNTIEKSSFSVIVAGESNLIESASFSLIGGGMENKISAPYSAIPGGRGLTLSGSASFGFLGGNTGSNDMSLTDSNVALFGNVDLWLTNNDNSSRQLRFYEAYGTAGDFPNGTNYTSFEAGTQTVDISYTLPTSAPNVNGEIMTSTTGGVMSWTSDATLTSLRLNGATAVTNSRLVVNEGHLTSQGTAPTAAGDGTFLAAGVIVATSATDVAGQVTGTDGGGIGTGVITITFDAAYTSNPIVTVTPANATAAGTTFYVSNTTTTSFDINIATTSGNGTDTYVFNYIVVETE